MTTSVSAAPTIEKPVNRSGSRARRRLATVGGLFAIVLVAAGCGDGPGSREDLIAIIEQDGAFTTAEATCMADAVFERYGEDDDALGKISAADDFAFFDTEDGIPGFAEFFDTTVQTCAAVGPTSG